jgi:hypothetical protein
MNIKLKILLLIVPLFLLSNCKKDNLTKEPDLDEVEQYVRSTRDSWAVYTYNQYRELLEELSKERYQVLPINEYRNYKSASKVLVGFRHDIDWHPFKALEMARLEYEYGISSTWYILPTAPYYGKYELNEINRFNCMAPVYRELQNLNCEVGIHLDLLTVMVLQHLDPILENRSDLNYFRSIGIHIHGAAAHGSKIAQITRVNNYEMFSDFTTRKFFTYEGEKYYVGQYSMRQYGFEYEAYHVDYSWYFSDVGGVWNVKNGSFDEFMKKLRSIPKGSRVELLIHPVWWGK